MARGWSFGHRRAEQQGIEKLPVDSIEQGFRLLDEGRIEGFAGYEVLWDFKNRELGRTGQYAKLPPFGATREFVTALKTNPNGEELLAAFDRRKREIIDNGTMERIRERLR